MKRESLAIRSAGSVPPFERSRLQDRVAEARRVDVRQHVVVGEDVEPRRDADPVRRRVGRTAGEDVVDAGPERPGGDVDVPDRVAALRGGLRFASVCAPASWAWPPAIGTPTVTTSVGVRRSSFATR